MRLWLLTAFYVLAGTCQAAVLTGRVIGVTNGNTITVIDARKAHHHVRLAGAYAPGLKQAFGSKSRENLSDLVNNQRVKVEWDKLDKNKRILGKVLFTPAVCVTPECVLATDVNREQIATGFAWHDKRHATNLSTGDRDSYAAAEKQAREAKRGLWADDKPVPPWEWHKAKK